MLLLVKVPFPAVSAPVPMLSEGLPDEVTAPLNVNAGNVSPVVVTVPLIAGDDNVAASMVPNDKSVCFDIGNFL